MFWKHPVCSLTLDSEKYINLLMTLQALSKLQLCLVQQLGKAKAEIYILFSVDTLDIGPLFGKGFLSGRGADAK